MDEPEIQRVVLTPQVLARSFFDPECRSVLECWRDRHIRLVVTRSLLERYLRLLSKSGLSQQLLRRWMGWFTSPERAVYLSETSPIEQSDSELCAQAARLGKARWIISHSKVEGNALEQGSPGQKVHWLTLSGFLAKQGEKEG